MLTLNNLSNLRELERDIRVFSRKEKLNKFPAKNNSDSFINRFIKTPIYYTFSIISLYFKSKYILRNIKKAIERDYKIFLESDERGKEDIYLAWEGYKKESEGFTKIHQPKSALLKPAAYNLFLFFKLIRDFEETLKNALYPNLDRFYSQSDLKKMSEKFKDLPRDILEGMISDEYSNLHF